MLLYNRTCELDSIWTIYPIKCGQIKFNSGKMSDFRSRQTRWGAIIAVFLPKEPLSEILNTFLMWMW